jgi:integrase
LNKRSTPRKTGGEIAVGTMGKFMGSVRGLLTFAVHRGFIASSPYAAELFKMKGKKGPKNKYRDFAPEELSKLFGSAIYNSTEDFKLTSNWWMPLLGLYTGARQGELVMLTPQDLKTEDGVRYFNVTSTDEREVKNGWSERKIPVHDKLIELGLLEFVHKMRRSRTLFPDVTASDNPQAAYSRRFARLLDRLDMADPKLVYHSFRHTFISKMREANVSKEHRMAITGHADEDAHDGYGQRAPLKVLGPEMQKLDYGIDWSELIKPTQ